MDSLLDHRKMTLLEERDGVIPRQSPSQLGLPAPAKTENEAVASFSKEPLGFPAAMPRLPVGLDNIARHRYASVSIPAGPLSQDTLSLGGFFIGGTV